MLFKSWTVGSKLNDDDERMQKDKVGADGLGERKGIRISEQYFSRSEDLVNIQTKVQFCGRNLRFWVSNQFPVNVDTAGLRTRLWRNKAVEVQIRSKVVLNLKMRVIEKERLQAEGRSNGRNAVDKKSGKKEKQKQRKAEALELDACS